MLAVCCVSTLTPLENAAATANTTVRIMAPGCPSLLTPSKQHNTGRDQQRARSAGEPELRVDRAVVTARQVVHGGREHGAARVDEHVVDRQERRLPPRAPGRDQPVAHLAGGV